MKYKTLKELFTGICDAVRTQKGITGEIDHQEIPDEILSIASTDLSGVTATADDVVSPKVFVDANGNEQTGTIPTRSSSDLMANGAEVSVPAGHYPSGASKSVATATQATPSITVSDTGLITAKATQSAGYVASGEKSATKQLTNRTASDLTVSGAQVTAPAGYYNTGVSKSVGTATQATPTVSIDSNGKITASATQTAGYVSAGTKTGTKQLTTKGATTITPTTSEQTAVSAGTYVTGDIKVAATEDLTAVLNAQETLISELEAELENKASGIYETWVFAFQQ